MDILRFITAGSVDDGKSTLIGRLLFDSKSIMADHLEAIEKQCRNKEDGEIDLALLTDGLRAEREQGITIDVAYKYFSTPKRKFIVADAPGHIQYTRNMVTGASNSNLAIILIDARKGVIEQTRRHTLIATLLNIPHIIVAVNKMDLVNYSQNVYNNVLIDYAELAGKLGRSDITYIPVSALNGDNIVERSKNLSWYSGTSLLDILENIPLTTDVNLEDGRLQVQYVIRPQSQGLHDYRGYAGKISAGVYRKGDAITVLPSGLQTTIKSLEIGGVEAGLAFAPQSVILQTEDDIDISRGDMVINAGKAPVSSSEISSILCWMDTKPLQPGGRYLLQHNSKTVRALISEVEYKLDINNPGETIVPGNVVFNDIIKVKIRTSAPLIYDNYKTLPSNGGAVLVDETSNNTVAACMFQ